jgi:hypothetical protein
MLFLLLLLLLLLLLMMILSETDCFSCTYAVFMHLWLSRLSFILWGNSEIVKCRED